MRVVLDANVLASAILTPGGETEAIRSQVEGRYILLLSDFLLEELDRVLHYSRIQSAFSHLTEERIAGYLANLREICELVVEETSVEACSDPDDNHILAIAVDGQADYLVTRNLSHFPSTYSGVKVISPTSFLHVIRQSQ